jgi:hypothetical protein
MSPSIIDPKNINPFTMDYNPETLIETLIICSNYVEDLAEDKIIERYEFELDFYSEHCSYLASELSKEIEKLLDNPRIFRMGCEEGKIFIADLLKPLNKTELNKILKYLKMNDYSVETWENKYIYTFNNDKEVY